MIAIEGCAELAVRGLEVYFHGSEERMLETARGDRVDGLEATSVLKKAKKEKRLQDWEEKALHSQYGVNKVGFSFRMEILREKDRKSDSCSTESEYKNKIS